MGDGGGQRLARNERGAADEDEVAADIEGGDFAREAHGIVEGAAVGHQGGGGENAAAVGFHDAFIDIGGEAEIIRVDHELLQNRVSRMVRNFLGLARMSLASDWNSRVVPVSDS